MNYKFRELLEFRISIKSYENTNKVAEMITIRFAGWISGRIVSLQSDKDIQKLLSNGNRIRIRISETLYQYFEDDSESVYGVNSEP